MKATTKNIAELSERRKEYIAELLKERIYATLALLAVLISIDARHYTAIRAGLVISGTILSLWAASIASALMSRRLVYQQELNHHLERERQLHKHSPMLAALGLPILLIGLAVVHILSLELAINLSIAGSLFLLVGWSLLSAHSYGASKTMTLLLASIELAIGIAIVSLKVLLGH